jgi:hypothetical protein
MKLRHETTSDVSGGLGEVVTLHAPIVLPGEGVSEDDLADELFALANDRASQLAKELAQGEVVRSWHPRPQLILSEPETDTTELTNDSTVASINRLHETRLHGLPEDRAHARRELAEIIHAAVGPLQAERRSSSAAFRIGRKIDSAVDRVADAPRIQDLPRALHTTWHYMGLVLSGVAALMIATGQLWPAVILIATRILISVLIGTPGLPADLGSNTGLRLDWAGCVLGHASDALVLSGVAALLLLSQRTTYGMAAFAAVIAMLTATLARVAALQHGVWVTRLRVERVFRNAPLLWILVLCAVVQPSVPTNGVPLVVFAALGALAFAGIEVGRLIGYWRRGVEARKHLDAASRYTDAAAQVLAGVSATIDPPEHSVG